MSHLRFFCFILFFFATNFLFAAPIKVGHVTAELISEMESIQPGHAFTIGLHLKMDPEWHTYWKNPGDAGLATKIDWTLPPGFTAGPIEWPVPQIIQVESIVSYGYSNEVFLLTTIQPSADLKSGTQVKILAHASWLVCQDICIPGKADLTLTLSVRDSAPVASKEAPLFAQTRAHSPKPLHALPAPIQASSRGDQVELQFPQANNPSLSKNAYFFADDNSMIASAAPQTWSSAGGNETLQLQRPPSQPPLQTISGILQTSDNAWEISVPVTNATNVSSSNSASSMPKQNQVPPAATLTGGSLLFALFSAFLGGLILNLMPCVLPVLSLKVLGFVRHAEQSGQAVWKQSIAFTTGVVVSFWILAALLISLRAAGQKLGWGFQMQSPLFVMFLGALFFIFALNLFGVFEIGTSLVGVDAKTANRNDALGAFGTGALATLAATPCTAPFMGSALGFAVGQSTIVAFLIFTFLGIGMASPYLLLGFFPALLGFIPKPGAWMESFKQFLGFLLIGTVIFMLSIFGQQTDVGTLVLLLFAFLLIGIGVWIYGRWSTPVRSDSTRIFAKIFAALFVVAGLYWGATLANSQPMSHPNSGNNATATSADGIDWEPFSPEKLAQLRANHQPVFIDFTAAWCLSCKVNEAVALNTEAVRNKLKEQGIVTMKGDWTRYDENITKILNQFGRDGVPLYLLYGRDPQQPPQVLPEVITPGIVIAAINKMK